MARESVFYSFHFDNDVFRVQQIRNMGVVDGTEPVSPNDWEQIRRQGDAAVKRWIDNNMAYKRCAVVLIGTETYRRPYVLYEIEKAWKEKRGLLGIYINRLKCPKNGVCAKGLNPFSYVHSGSVIPISVYLTVHEPNFWDAYGDIKSNMASWVNRAIEEAATRR